MNRSNLFAAVLATAGLAMLSACADLSLTNDAAGSPASDEAAYGNSANPLGADSKVDPLAPSPG
jgi:hypothetical protein